MVRSRLPER